MDFVEYIESNIHSSSQLQRTITTEENERGGRGRMYRECGVVVDGKGWKVFCFPYCLAIYKNWLWFCFSSKWDISGVSFLLFLEGFMARKGMNCIQFVNDITKHSSNQYQGVGVFQLVRVFFFRMELQIGFCGFVWKDEWRIPFEFKKKTNLMNIALMMIAR